ncbi:hypothetical protein [Nonomuraea sp. B5E05]|uniref:hypothetical protein n=1 Tax=Nonomuraea sp. B5E05 TaxID=3153569 RepID=UPI0032609764
MQPPTASLGNLLALDGVAIGLAADPQVRTVDGIDLRRFTGAIHLGFTAPP